MLYIDKNTGTESKCHMKGQIICHVIGHVMSHRKILNHKSAMVKVNFSVMMLDEKVRFLMDQEKFKKPEI